jgi:L-lactate dehydrogenase complex protein LldG
MSHDRDQILSRVRAALAPLAKRAPLLEWDEELVQLRGARTPVDAWALFAERLRAVNGTPLDQIAALVALLQQNHGRRGYCDPALWPVLRPAFPAEFNVEIRFDRTRIDDYDFGITSAVGAIAETGTIILGDHTTSSRLAAVAPWTHVAVIKREQIHPDLTAALTALPDDPNLIFVTGPSKTADVEGILIEGVHGPGVQVALLL